MLSHNGKACNPDKGQAKLCSGQSCQIKITHLNTIPENLQDIFQNYYKFNIEVNKIGLYAIPLVCIKRSLNSVMQFCCLQLVLCTCPSNRLLPAITISIKGPHCKSLLQIASAFNVIWTGNRRTSVKFTKTSLFFIECEKCGEARKKKKVKCKPSSSR